ncbi:MAG: CoA pyrophosphatase [Halomonadaceae bacterium]|nr:MAG: CoA pyrophosphatase [Halomonadaceae bacterium]
MIERLRQKLAGYEPRKLAVSYPEAAILVPVTYSGNPEIILTQRTTGMSTHSGQVAFPGGMREPADESLLHTALRESEEEIGLRREQVEVISPLSQVVSLHSILVSPFAAVIPEDCTFVPQEKELDAIFRVPVSFFLEDRRLRTDTVTIAGNKLHIPCYQWETYQIWGLSAAVLVDFLNVAYDAGIDLSQPDPKAVAKKR